MKNLLFTVSVLIFALSALCMSSVEKGDVVKTDAMQQLLKCYQVAPKVITVYCSVIHKDGTPGQGFLVDLSTLDPNQSCTHTMNLGDYKATFQTKANLVGLQEYARLLKALEELENE
ncbi:MAG: hypothetical protein KAR40_06170 [Candidatus Sabulitectum sp.]|nr:hypothetical protein [Candidatus Sabulitectum sp.]